MVTMKGMFTTVLVGDELVAYGTQAAALNLVLGKVKSFTPSPSNNLQEAQGVGDGRNYDYTAFGNFDLTWTLNMEMVDFGFAKYLIGPLSGSGTTASPYLITEADHMGIAPTTQILPFSIQVGTEAGTTDDVDTYTGCALGEFTINFANGGVVTVDLNGVAQKPTSAASGAVAYGSLNVLSGASAYLGTRTWTANHITVAWGTKSSEANVAKVQSGSITVTNNNFIYRNLGSRFIDMPEAMTRRYTGTLLLIMTDTIANTFRDHFYGQANSPADALTSPNPTVKSLKLTIAEGTASTQRQAQIYLDGVTIDTISKPVDLGGGLVQFTANLKAKQSSGTNGSGEFCRFWTTT